MGRLLLQGLRPGRQIIVAKDRRGGGFAAPRDPVDVCDHLAYTRGRAEGDRRMGRYETLPLALEMSASDYLKIVAERTDVTDDARREILGANAARFDGLA
jgi:hypothetical protein